MEAAATVRDLPPARAQAPTRPPAPTSVDLSARRTDEWIHAVNSGAAPFGTTRTQFHRVKDAVSAEAQGLSTRAFPDRERQALSMALLQQDPAALGSADLLRLVKQAAPTLARQLRPDELERRLQSLAARLR